MPKAHPLILRFIADSATLYEIRLRRSVCSSAAHACNVELSLVLVPWMYEYGVGTSSLQLALGVKLEFKSA